MANVDQTSTPMRIGIPRPLLALGLVLIAELLIISLTYRHGFEFDCRAAAPQVLCAALGYGVIRAIAITGAMSVLFLRRANAVGALMNAMRPALHSGWMAVQIAGVLAILAPLTFLGDGASQGTLWLAFLLWGGGLAAAGIGALMAIVQGRGWTELINRLGLLTLGAIIVIAGFAPEIAAIAQKAWHWPVIADITFDASEWMLKLLANDVISEPEFVRLGLNDFIVLVGPQCSGVEGFALITAFNLFYIWLFRDRLKFPLVWILIPIGILLSWFFNVVRITALILIGAYISPDLAINGFHSHAGWMMFTILAVGVAILVHRTALFRLNGDDSAAVKSDAPPLLEDPIAAKIIPFMVFMGSSLLASTFFELPSLYYPARMLAMLAVLWLFRDMLARIDWRIDPLSAGVGLVIGVLWIATAPIPDDSDQALTTALNAMPPVLFMIWAISRVIGTSLLVPIIEELFFRGYVFARIDSGSLAMRILAIAVSSGLFALLHGRWLEAGLAGIAFALLYIRDRRLADPIVAHAVANGAIAAWAVARGDWAVI